MKISDDLSILDGYAEEKRVSVFKRNDRESPKGQRPLPSNQNSYVLRDKYPFRDGTIGYFMNLLGRVQIELTADRINILDIRSREEDWWLFWIWNKIVAFLHFDKLYIYASWCYSNRFPRPKGAKKRAGSSKEYHWWMSYRRMERCEKEKFVAYPCERVLHILHDGTDKLYNNVAFRYLFEREDDAEELSEIARKVMHERPKIDPRGPGMRIYPHYSQFDHLQGKALVEAYLDSEPMIELILARCEQELEIRINESLISVDEVVEKIRTALAPMQWRLEVEL